ncbi:MAG: hypothetical protein P8P30_09385 [Rickettsiales bacterium]|nr:hypothetical protein [Rickettsiales bacterium]
MLKTHISAFFFLLCLLLFSLGALFSLPPQAEGWKIETPNFWGSIRGETASHLEKELEDKLAYKETATQLWGSIRYDLFKTGSKGVVIGKDNWLFTKEEFETTPEFQTHIEANYQRIDQMMQKLDTHDIKAVMAWIPSKARFHADQLGGKAQPGQHLALTPPHSIPLIDGSHVFASLKDSAFMRTDTHWSQEAALAMAQAVATYIHTEYPALELASKAFTTTTKEAQAYEGDLTEFAPSFSFAGPTSDLSSGSETIQSYQTHAVSTETASLFGDETLDVVLIGTSYSAQKDWHFEGFLKQVLQMDILNLADEGEGPFAPMETFLARLEKGETTAKFVIWEFPERYLPREYKKKGVNK